MIARLSILTLVPFSVFIRASPIFIVVWSETLRVGFHSPGCLIHVKGLRGRANGDCVIKLVYLRVARRILTGCPSRRRLIGMFLDRQ